MFLEDKGWKIKVANYELTKLKHPLILQNSVITNNPTEDIK